jgi:hypothetical protein
LERNTGAVPDDSYFYVLLKGEVVGRHRTLKQATRQYKEIVSGSGWKPDGLKPGDPAKEAVERYLDDLAEYWGTSHTHRRRGGKSMYRS